MHDVGIIVLSSIWGGILLVSSIIMLVRLRSHHFLQQSEQTRSFLRTRQLLGVISFTAGLLLLYQGIFLLVTRIFSAANTHVVGTVIFFAEITAMLIFFSAIFQYFSRKNVRREQGSLLLRYADDPYGNDSFHGLSPVQILHQAQEGRGHPTWLVFRPRRANLYTIIGLTVSATMLLSMLFFIGTFYPSLLDEAPVNLLTLLLRVVLPSVCLTIVINTLVLRGVKRTKDALLIVLPEGVVQCERCSDNARRYFYVIVFADVVAMNMRKFSDKNSGLLELHYNNGREEVWHANGKFAPPAWLARRVLANYTRYVERNKPGTR